MCWWRSGSRLLLQEFSVLGISALQAQLVSKILSMRLLVLQLCLVDCCIPLQWPACNGILWRVNSAACVHIGLFLLVPVLGVLNTQSAMLLGSCLDLFCRCFQSCPGSNHRPLPLVVLSGCSRVRFALVLMSSGALSDQACLHLKAGSVALKRMFVCLDDEALSPCHVSA